MLTVAASSGGAPRGVALLAVYALGMAGPLFLMALLWDRLDLGKRRWLRGREVGVWRLRFHTTNLISGAMFILLGILFIAYEGTSVLAGLYASNGATDAAFAAEEWANGFSRSSPAGLAILVLGVVLLGFVYTAGSGARRGPPPIVETRRLSSVGYWSILISQMAHPGQGFLAAREYSWVRVKTDREEQR